MNCPKCAGIMVSEKVNDYFRPFWIAKCLLCGKRCSQREVEMPRFKSAADKDAWVEKCRRTRALKHTEQEPLEIPESEPEITFNRIIIDKDKVAADLKLLKEASWPAVSDKDAADRLSFQAIDFAIKRALDEAGILQKAKDILSRHPIPEVTSV